MRDSLLRGEAPIASHMLYPGALDDNDPRERAMGIEAGLQWGAKAEASVVYTDRGINRGMRLGIERALTEGRTVELRSLDGKGPAMLDGPLSERLWAAQRPV